MQGLLRFLPLDDMSVFKEEPSIAIDLDVLPNGPEVPIAVSFGEDRLDAFKQGRMVLKFRHTAIQRRWCFVPITPRA